MCILLIRMYCIIFINHNVPVMKTSSKLSSKKEAISEKRKKKLFQGDSNKQSNDVLVSAVISPYLLTHLHQILQQSEFTAKKAGRGNQEEWNDNFDTGRGLRGRFSCDPCISRD